MLIKNIEIINNIIDIENDNVDVCGDSEDGYTYTISIATTKNILQEMDREKTNFFTHPVIIVRKLTEEIITEALEACPEDNGFWLKLHHFASKIDISVFDELQVKHKKELIESNLLCGLEDLENEINKFDNLNNAQKSNLTARIEKLAQLLDSE
jgi:hypothetical protein